jgi:hypothetical protein
MIGSWVLAIYLSLIMLGMVVLTVFGISRLV